MEGKWVAFAGSFWLCSDHIGLSVEFLPAKLTNILEIVFLAFVRGIVVLASAT